MPSFVRRYLVTHLPPDSVDATIWGVNVEWRGADQWAVTHLSGCLTADGEILLEPLPSSRTEEFKAATRFDLDTALALAEDYADQLVMNGRTWRDLDRYLANPGQSDAQ